MSASASSIIASRAAIISSAWAREMTRRVRAMRALMWAITSSVIPGASRSTLNPLKPCGGHRSAQPRIQALMSALGRKQTPLVAGLLLEPVPSPEHPGDHGHAAGDDRYGDQRARPDGDVGHRVEAPAEAADHVDDRVEKGDRPEWLVQRLHRVEGAAEEGQRRDHQHRDDLQLLEILGPHADREAEQAKAGADPYEE